MKRKKLLLSILLVIIAIVILSKINFGYFLLYILSWCDTHSGLITACATVTLAIITVYYVIEAQRSRKASEQSLTIAQKALNLEMRPLIIVDWNRKDLVKFYRNGWEIFFKFKIVFTNIGKTTAVDLEPKIEISNDNINFQEHQCNKIPFFYPTDINHEIIELYSTTLRRNMGEDPTTYVNRLNSGLHNRIQIPSKFFKISFSYSDEENNLYRPTSYHLKYIHESKTFVHIIEE